jgi:hypothetical protein
MAEKQAADKQEKRAAAADSGGPVKGGGIVAAVANGLVKAWNAVMADGMLEAAGRQGIDELGAALKAFPDTIQVQETGTLWNPTPGEVAADRQQSKQAGGSSRTPWPSEIANANRHLPGKDHSGGHDNSHDAGHSM